MSYVKLRYHIVTATENHQPFLEGEVEDLVRGMLVHSTQELGAKLFRLGGCSDHMHLVVGLPAELALSDLVRHVKGCSSRVVNQNQLVKGGFAWAEGYAAISLSPFDLSEVMRYVADQKYYHQTNQLWDVLEELPAPGESSFTRLRYHLVTATKYRDPLMVDVVEEMVYREFERKAQKMECVLLELNGVPDHLHAVAAVRPKIAVASFMHQVKRFSSRRVNNKRLLGKHHRFGWQRGYGAFTVWPFDLYHVRHYVRNQKTHHRDNHLWHYYEKTSE